MLVCFHLVLSCTTASDGKFVSDGTDFVIGNRCYCPSRQKRSLENTKPCGPVCVYGNANSNEIEKYQKNFTHEITNIFSGHPSVKKEADNFSKSKVGVLSYEEVLSLYTYTLENPNTYRMFNKETREIGPSSDKFKYKALYFFIHQAVNKLATKTMQRVYRKVSYNVTALVNAPFYFNCFTSTSTLKNELFLSLVTRFLRLKHTKGHRYGNILNIIMKKNFSFHLVHISK